MKPVKPIAQKINRLKLKANRKVGNNAGRADNSCPYCLSKLIVEKGKLKCTAERILMWVSEFKLFANLGEQNQFAYLSRVADPDRFLELFRKWETNDLDCLFNNRYYNPLGNVKEEILDPMVVGRIESSINRSLTEEEKAGEQPLWTNGKDYFDSYEKGRVLFKIPTVTFPDDV